MDAVCLLCGKPFMARERVLKRGWGRFCCKRHANHWRSLFHNPNAKGGRSYHRERVSPEQRERVRRRDGDRCVQCGEPDRIIDTVKGPKHWLQVHHVVAVRADGTSDEDWNLVSLCPGCHNRIEHGRDVLRYTPPRPDGFELTPGPRGQDVPPAEAREDGDTDEVGRRRPAVGPP